MNSARPLSTSRGFASRAVRRLVTAATLTLIAGVAATGFAASASATSSSDPAYVGLFGAQDPTYDGVYRQGLAILALTADGQPVDPAAVSWLERQQCANGGWLSFRADLSAPCASAAQDSNATAMAVMALEQLGGGAAGTAAKAGVTWLVSRQLSTGGWEYSTGWGEDANSTGLATQALLSAGTDPAQLVSSSGATPYDVLAGLQLGCDSVADERGALDYQAESPLAPNDYATVQAIQALAGAALPIAAGAPAADEPSMVCPANSPNTAANDQPAADPAVVGPADLAAYGAGYLARRLDANGGLVPSAFGPGADYGTTANAVLALVASGHGATAVAAADAALKDAAAGYTSDKQGTVVASTAILSLVAHAAGDDSASYGGVNLTKNLTASLTAKKTTSGGNQGNGGNTVGGSGGANHGGDPGDGGSSSSTSPTTSAASSAELPKTGSSAAADGLLASIALVLIVAGGLVIRDAREKTG